MKYLLLMLLLFCSTVFSQSFSPAGTISPGQFYIPPIQYTPSNPLYNNGGTGVDGFYELSFGSAVLVPAVSVSGNDLIIRLRFNAPVLYGSYGINSACHPNMEISYVFVSIFPVQNYNTTFTPFGFLSDGVFNSIIVEFFIPNTPSYIPGFCPYLRWLPVVNACPFGSGNYLDDVQAAIGINFLQAQSLVGLDLQFQMAWYVGDGTSNYCSFFTSPSIQHIF